jgi:hypothetical protein
MMTGRMVRGGRSRVDWWWVVQVLVAGLAMALVLAGCGEERAVPWVDARLYLGQSDAKGAIPPADFQAFADGVITPAFPDGLTIYHADGQWQAPDQARIREGTAVVELIFHDTDENRARILDVIAQYKRRFHQQSVLLVVTHPSVDFR